MSKVIYYAARLREDPTNYLHTGRNSKSKKELKEDLVELLIKENYEDEKGYRRLPLWEVLDYLDLRLAQSKNKFLED